MNQDKLVKHPDTALGYYREYEGWYVRVPFGKLDTTKILYTDSVFSARGYRASGVRAYASKYESPSAWFTIKLGLRIAAFAIGYAVVKAGKDFVHSFHRAFSREQRMKDEYAAEMERICRG